MDKEKKESKVTPGLGPEQLEGWNCQSLRWEPGGGAVEGRGECD